MMLLLFVAYYVDVNFFAHVHIINGVTIVHSHIHGEHHHDTEAGGHTVSEIALIANMAGQFLSTGETDQTEPEAIVVCLLTLDVWQDAEVLAVHLACPSLRGPPSRSALESHRLIPLC